LPEQNYSTFFTRALKLRCPRCGEGPLFKNFITMHQKCPRCSLKYERAPGYFLGSTYLNYGFMAFSTMSAYFALHYGANFSNDQLSGPLLIYCIVMPLILFRYARSWWLAMDCYCDPIEFGMHPDPTEDKR
jgi:uncharacterized protein (DUF983 family)